MYTLFRDGKAIADLTGNPNAGSPLVASVASLKPYDPAADEPALDADTATSVVGAVASYANYGAERNDPCIFCSDDRDGMARASQDP